ncbi:MAG: cytochrome c biogenesis protein ResB [Limisphaerales bacterium]
MRLTVVLLGLALLLVFVGTLAQVKLGLYVAQSEYFRSLFVYWSPKGAHWKIPILPGGWLLGGLLLINLIAAHIKRFSLARKKIGIFLIHGGLILLLVGQFLTELFQIESNMRIPVGETRNYTEDSRKNELAIIDLTNPERDKVVSIPESLLIKQKEIRDSKLPFTIRLKNYFENSRPAGPMETGGNKIKATQGIGQRLQFSAAPPTAAMDDENKPVALVEIISDKGAIGNWAVSTWLTKFPWKLLLQDQVGNLLGNVEEPQIFSYNGHTYQIALRPIRYYKPYSVTVLDFKHDIYQGTDIPKNFSSKIHLKNPQTGDDRDVLIFMNNPLRHGGETFYQSGFEPGDKVTVLQVVKNPAYITPYLACSIIGLGLLTQFLMHLIGFGKKTTQKNKTIPPQKISSPQIEPALATKRSRS